MSARHFDGPECLGSAMDNLARFARGMILLAPVSLAVGLVTLPFCRWLAAEARYFPEATVLILWGFFVFGVAPGISMACAFGGQRTVYVQRGDGGGRPPEDPEPQPEPTPPGGVQLEDTIDAAPARSIFPDFYDPADWAPTTEPTKERRNA